MTPRLLLPLLLAFAFALAACDTGDPEQPSAPPNAQGLVTIESSYSAQTAVDTLLAAIEGNEDLQLLADIDHAAAAAQAGLELRPTRVLLFGNPRLSAPMMVVVPSAGIDLPPKILVYEDADSTVHVAYNAPAYLRARHGGDDLDTVLERIRTASYGLASRAAGSTPTLDAVSADSIAASEGMVITPSAFEVDTTYRRLRAAVEESGALTIMAEVDHRERAALINTDMNRVQVLVFGNPQLGTPLMQAAPTLGLDLPQKILVYEDNEGQVQVAYNDPFYLAGRHGLDGQRERLDQIEQALEQLVAAATQEEEDDGEE